MAAVLLMQFEYPEDRDYFVRLLADGDYQKFEEAFGHLFDFRSPAIKRREFNKVRGRMLEDLLAKYGEQCQLRIHADCMKARVWEPDHIIPLSTNELNKTLRHMEAGGGKKVPAQSFGSNHPANLILACKRCNAFKKHRLLDARAVSVVPAGTSGCVSTR